jgi:hypothetical protein
MICPTCCSDVPAHAKFCTVCKHWIEEPAQERRERRAQWTHTLITGLALPIGIFVASAVVECGSRTRADTAEALQRDSAVMESLSDALKKLADVSDRFLDASHAMEDACRHRTLESGGREGEPCERKIAEALHQFDHLLSQLSWALDTVPVASTTYNRSNRLKERYYLPCRNDEREEFCGYRQAIVRRVAVEKGRLGLCTIGDVAGCNREIEAMKGELLNPFRDDMVALLCSLTKDANELRAATWRALGKRGYQLHTGIEYGDLADRLVSNQGSSRCTDLLNKSPVTGNGLAGPRPFKRNAI